MEKAVARFRRQVEAHFGGRPGPGCRYPEALRSLAVEVVSARLAEGWSLATVAEELGVGVVTLRRWFEAAPVRRSPLRAIEVVGDDPASADASTPGEGLVLTTAGGHRVERLTLAEVALLLESLA